MNRHRIQPKIAVGLDTVSLRLPAQLVRAVGPYAKYLGGSFDRTYVITQSIEIPLQQDADSQRTLTRHGQRPGGRRRPPECVVALVAARLQNTLTPGEARPAPPASSRHTPVFTAPLAATHGGPSPFTRQ